MILQILLGLSLLNLASNFLNHFRIKELMLKEKQNELKDQMQSVQTLEKVEEDLNRRLRMLQTTNFAPKMGRQNVRFVESHERND